MRSEQSSSVERNTRFAVAVTQCAMMTLAPGFYEMLSTTDKTSHGIYSFSRAWLAFITRVLGEQGNLSVSA